MQKSAMKPAIYISYAWGSESEAIAESVEREFLKRDLPIIRDKKVLGYKGRIKDFMAQIGRAKYVILVISNKYLRSVNCMFELVQIFKNEHFYERIFPVVLDEVKIFKTSDRVALMKYWENETESLNHEIKQLKDLSNIQGLTDDLNLNTEIRNNIARLTNILKDTNTLTIHQLVSTDFAQLYEAVQKKVQADFKDGADDDAEGTPNISDSGSVTESDGNRITKYVKRMAMAALLLFGLIVAFMALKKDGPLEENKVPIDSTAIVERKTDSLRTVDERADEKDSVFNTVRPIEEKTDAKVSGVRYTVELVVPSEMAQATVFVDGKPAEIVERSPISITVRLRKKNSSHHFEVREGIESCVTDKLISEDNVRLTLCE